ncbi:hypothetical protein JOD82_001790 [Paenibacillus sp. 1182]|uniref:hypothetical protein n=1 Tax=Paenibacillus sp. 1182 TaxID=2806565 RepID=UPI001AE32036|nr:hypothetical protein [Paenibacillus sp. 1182]MBP1308770.1 hypothetical protein [Paenibacillus sp. 1182]
MNRLKQLLKNKKGSFSILFVILIFIGVMMVTAFVDILIESWSMQEVQSVMDTSGVSALRASVDETKLRIGEFDVEKNVAISEYKKLVSMRLKDTKKIKSVHFNPIEIESFTEKWGTGETKKARPQVLLDSSVVIVVSGSTIFDLIPGTAEKFYNSRRGSDFEVSYLGTNNDGNIELAVRSVSRLVYR